ERGGCFNPAAASRTTEPPLPPPPAPPSCDCPPPPGPGGESPPADNRSVHTPPQSVQSDLSDRLAPSWPPTISASPDSNRCCAKAPSLRTPSRACQSLGGDGACMPSSPPRPLLPRLC